MRISTLQPALVAIAASALILFASSALAQTPDLKRDLVAADHLRQLGMMVESLAAYEKLVDNYGGDPKVLKAAAVAATKMRDLRASAKWFERLKVLDPADISTREALLLGYSQLGDTAAFETERADLIRFWHETTDSSAKSRHLFLRERFSVRDYEVGAFECFTWQGRFALKYIFRVKPPTTKTEYWITMGSYYERQRFHIDIYRGPEHSLLWLSDNEPSYAVVREKVLIAIEDNSVDTGKHLLSSSIRGDRRSNSPSSTCQLGVN